MKKDNEIIDALSKNLIYYRKANNLTQIDLAIKIDYSDKSISKWERGEGIPDLLVLSKLANLYDITVNDLLSSKPPVYKSSNNKKRFYITILSAMLPWLVATIIFVLFNIILKDLNKSWLIFIYAIPTTAIILIVFSKLWWRNSHLLLSLSILYWTIPLCLYLSLDFENIYLFFYIAIPLQLLTILWFFMKHNNKKNNI